MAVPDPSDILTLAASGQERSELLLKRDTELLAQVESLKEWLDSEPTISEAHRAALTSVASTWRAMNDQRFDLMVRQAENTAKLLAEIRAPDPRKAAVLRGQAGVLDALALTARLCGAMLTATDAIEARLAEDAES